MLALYTPKQASGINPILYFHALARLGLEGLIIIEPNDSFVSVGYFDNTKAVIDLEYCKLHKIPIVRREIGGGPVLLGPGQIFYNLVLNRKNKVLPPSIKQAYKIFSTPIIDTYAHFGIKANYKFVNDLITDQGRKIAGQGAADIGGYFCFVGAILTYFDIKLMSKVLRVPEEKFRDKIFKTLEDNLSWIERETGNQPPFLQVLEILVQSFSKLLGELEQKELPLEVYEVAKELEKQFSSDQVLYRNSKLLPTATKIRGGLYLRQGIHKSPGGLIRTEVETKQGVIKAIDVYGDFTFIPKDSFWLLLDSLIEVPFNFESVRNTISDFIESNQIQCPGVAPEDFAMAIVGKGNPPNE